MRTHLMDFNYFYYLSYLVYITWIIGSIILIKRLQDYPPLISYRLYVYSKKAITLTLKIMKSKMLIYDDIVDYFRLFNRIYSSVQTNRKDFIPSE